MVIDGPWLPFPRVTAQAVAFPGLLVASANVAAGRVGPARCVPRRGAGTATSFVPRMEVTTTIPAKGPRRTRPAVRPTDALRAGPIVAEAMAGVEVAKGAAVTTPLVATGLPSTTPARVPVGAYVAPR